MNIHEYQAKAVLKEFGVPVSNGKAIMNASEAEAAAKALGGPLWVVKSQIHAGGRGKGGGVKVAKSIDDVKRLAGEGCQVLGLRFDGDRLVGTRFDTLRRELGDAFIAVEYPSSKRTDHSVVTEQRVDDAVEQVLAFFHRKLRA